MSPTVRNIALSNGVIPGVPTGHADSKMLPDGTYVRWLHAFDIWHAARWPFHGDGHTYNV